MFNDLKGKRALITGSTAGMGLAAARLFARYGARIGINSHNGAAEAVAELRSLGARLSSSRPI